MDCDTTVTQRPGLALAGASAEAAGDDDTLARRIAAGDVDAWDSFFDRFAPWAYRFAYHHLSANHADAEDLCSDILMTAAKSIGRFDARQGTLDVWLLGVARHRLARFCRRRRIEMPMVPETTGADAAPESTIPDPVADDALTRQLVNRALAALPQRQAQALIGKYVLGHSVEELARSTGTTPKAVESLLSRARAAFRSAFAQLGGTSGGDNRE